ncbi:MAG TPA: SDR family oxidoreductase [Bacteroidales bacterium]|jgi:NAD(P)-dependent dehydrogenase (short-subunit alcohol dehydrogenase family)|nr:SDR family oxidoreductase [Bacteroidales bacterium]HOS71864.1 SDR family oxidoreductase [Bacteroidales bacterium]HQK70275.1 SDR family oxidoreductase [Bacteroidales bacterium]
MNSSGLYNLNGKTALVTGSSQGIGKAIATSLARHGADIIIHYKSEDELARETVAEIRKLDQECISIKADLSKADAADFIFNECSKFKPVDILVLNASVQIRKKWQEITPEEFDLQINVNLRSSLMLMQKFIDHMQEQKWGKILTIGSVQQKRPHPDMLVYSASKSAIANMVKSLAVQLAPFNINVNNIAPGVFGTVRNKEALNNPVYLKKVSAKIPLGYIATPEDCSALAVLLCTDAGKYITGEDIFIDGGMNIPS